MRFFVFICFNILISVILNCQSKWYRGNTHTHTTYSDGNLTPAEVAVLYKNEGYHFLFITDHGRVAPITESLLSDSSFLCIKGEESESYHHLSCLNINQTIYSTYPPHIIDSTIAQGGFLIVNHPLRGNHEVYTRDIWDIEEFKHIEIFNGKSEKDGYHDDQSLWDSLLTSGKLFYGVASDDFHETKHLAKGWIMVQADTLQKDSIIKAIKNGDFYSSTGVFFSEIKVTDTTIQINSPNAIKIEFIGNKKTSLQTNNSNTALYKIKGNEGYIRAEASNTAGEKAWTQPLFWNKTFEGKKADTTIAVKICRGENYFGHTNEGISYVTKKSSLNTDSIIKVHLTVIPSPVIFVYHQLNIKPDETILLQPENNFNKYLWNTNDTIKSINITGSNLGEYKYWLKVESNNGCNFTDTVTVMVKTGLINYKILTNETKIYPNPVNENFTVSINSNKNARADITIFDESGCLKYKQTFEIVKNHNIIPFYLKTLSSGIYFIKIQIENETFIEKMIIIAN